jgi:putative membrane-bound dehydrogenase-like protein
MKALVLCLFTTLSGAALAADAIPTISTYKKQYGETKNPVTVDPSKDLPRYPAVEPKDAVSTWKIKKGFKLELAAHEPQVNSPIAMCFDERGRMFVCEMIDYSERRDVKPHLGRVSMLEDKDGDGVYETSTVFADDLPWPTGIIWANGGLYVIATPDIFFFKDSRGSGKADVREKVFTGFGTELKILNVQGLANCPQWGQDNRIHIQVAGGNRGMVKCLKRPELPAVEIAGRDFWFDPRTYEFGLEAGGAQYGMSFDNYGRKFACSNSDHLQFFVYDDRTAAHNPFSSLPPARQSIAADGGAAEVYRISPDEPWRIVRTRWRIAGVVKGAVEGGGRVSGYFTGATGTTVYRGDAYGDDFVGNTFTGDAGGQLVHRKKIYPNGASLLGKRPDDEQNYEFAASKDTWVRVVNFANAPDGCLYVIDMYREVIEHPFSIPDEIKKYLDLNSGCDRGRLWRIAPDRADWKRRATVDLSKASTEDLVKALEHANGWHRDTATRLLYEKQDKAAVPLLEAMVKSSDNALARLHALSVLDGMASLSPKIIAKALSDKDEHVRERAIALSEKLSEDGRPPTLAGVVQALRDVAPRVRMQAALAIVDYDLNHLPVPASGSPTKRWSEMAALLARDFQDKWISAAVLSAAPENALQMLGEFEHGTLKDEKPDSAIIASLVRSAAATKDKAQRVALLGDVASRWADPSTIRALADGLKRAGASIAAADTEKRFAPVFAKASETVRHFDGNEQARLEALKLVSLDTPNQAVPVLIDCLGKSERESVQAEAVAALGQFSGTTVTSQLIDQWPALQKKAKAAAFSVLLSRPERATALLHAISAKKIPSSELTPADAQALFKHKDPSVAALASDVLAELKPPSRSSVIAKFQPAIAAKGDAAHGQIVYTQRCMACHRANNLGIQVGPDLITVKTKGRDGIMTAILDPNKEVAAQYIAYTVETKDGQTLLGIITHDDANSLAVKMQGGAEINVARTNVKGSSSSGQSLMPEGIEAGMTVQEMTDLLSFIEELK